MSRELNGLQFGLSAPPPDRGGPDEAWAQEVKDRVERGLSTEGKETGRLIVHAQCSEANGDTALTLRQIAQAQTWLDLWRARLLSAQGPKPPGS